MATEIAIGEFLDHFYTTPLDGRHRLLQDEPPLLDDPQINALAGAIAEHLAKSWISQSPPSWAAAQSRFLPEPWFAANAADAGLREYLTFSSPAAFKRRNIMTDGSPLRRATTPARIA